MERHRREEQHAEVRRWCQLLLNAMDVLEIVWTSRLQFAVANSSHASSTPATTLAEINAEVEACEMVSGAILHLVEDMEAVDRCLNAFNNFLGAAADNGGRR